MGHKQLGKVTTYTWLGLAALLVFATHGSSAISVPITVNNGQTVRIIFSRNFFTNLVENLCNDETSTYVFYTNILHAVYGIPQTVSGKLDQLANWQMDISYEDHDQPPGKKLEYNLTRHSSDDSVKDCFKKTCNHIWVGTSSCKDEPEVLYLGGNRLLEIDDEVQVCSYKYNNDTKDELCGKFKDVTGDDAEKVDNKDNDIEEVIEQPDSMTSTATQGQGTGPLIAGIIIAVIASLFIIAIIALFLWKWKSPKNKEEYPTVAAFSSGACTSSEFVHENAQNEVVESRDSESASKPPPSYDDVEGNSNVNTQHGFTNDAFAVSSEVTLR